MKKCSKCLETKPFSEFHRHNYSADGYKSRCKPCNTADAARWQVTNRERYLSRYRSWAAENRETTRAAARAWAARNPGLAHSRQVEIHGRDAVNERSRRQYAKNLARSRKVKSEWKSRNPDYMAAWAAKRRAATVQAIPAWADLDRIQDIYAQARTAPGTHVDHIVPLISPLVCGLHWEGNLQLLEARRNISKSNRSWPDMP